MRPILIFILALILLSGCRIFYPYKILKETGDVTYVSPDSLPYKPYTIQTGDFLSIQVFSNNGVSLVNLFSGGSGGSSGGGSSLHYLVEEDGSVYLPAINYFQIEGSTIEEAQRRLIQAYDSLFVDPLVTLSVLNRRVSVFNGGPGGTVVQIDNEYTPLIEVLASAGGFAQTGKAHEIKIVRRSGDSTLISEIDLRKDTDIDLAYIPIQSGDLIYVEPIWKPGVAISEVTPILSLLTTLVAVYFGFIKKN